MESREEINMSKLSKADSNLRQLNGNVWKKALIASVNPTLSWNSLNVETTYILAHWKEVAFCSTSESLLVAMHQEPKQL